MKGTEAEACELTMQACILKVGKVIIEADGEIVWQQGNVDLTFELLEECCALKLKTRKRSKITKDLHSPKYRQRVKPDKKKQDKGKSLEEILEEADDA
jgi:hypothetical protein